MKACRFYTQTNSGGQCPAAIHTLAPYKLSFQQGASFPWRANKNDVICQCPHPNGVVFLVTTCNSQINAKIIEVGDCPHKYKVDQEIPLK